MDRLMERLARIAISWWWVSVSVGLGLVGVATSMISLAAGKLSPDTMWVDLSCMAGWQVMYGVMFTISKLWQRMYDSERRKSQAMWQ